METNVEEISQVKRRIGVEIEAKEVSKKLDMAYRELSKRAKVRGFRPGKIPRKILEQYYNKQVLADVKNTLIEESFTEVLRETKLFPIGQPSIEDGAMRPGENFKYTILMEVRPEFELKDYLGLPVEKEIINVSKQTVDKRLEEIKEAHANLVSITEDREIRDGDYVVIDYESSLEDKPFKQISGKEFLIHVGSKNFYPEVESAMVGCRKGDKKDITVDFKDDFFDKRVAGKTVTFHITVQDLKEKELPMLNDAFARSLSSEFKSLAALRKTVKEEIALQEEKRTDRELKRRLLKDIAATVGFELPEAVVENELQRQIALVKQNLLLSGTQFESTGISEEKMRQDLRKTAEERVKEEFVLAKIATLENITVEDRDINNGFQELAAQTQKDQATIRRYYEQNNLIDSFRNQLLSEKVLNHVFQAAKITEVKKRPKSRAKKGKETKADVDTNSRRTNVQG
jgi:trigger factor